MTGILALQGAFVEHGIILDELGEPHFEIRQKKDLEHDFDRLILPGGESTVMGKLLQESELYDPLKEKIEKGMPVFGTCAGLILLAKEVQDGIVHLGTMDVCAKRNAYGRQLGSFRGEADFEGIGIVPMTFIRAPYIVQAGQEVEILTKVDGNIVAARQGKQLVTSFHPELDGDTRIHAYFMSL